MPDLPSNPITLRTKSLQQWTDEKLIEAGYDVHSDGSFVKTVGNCRYTVRRVDGGYATTVDMLVGVKVFDVAPDDPELQDWRANR